MASMNIARLSQAFHVTIATLGIIMGILSAGLVASAIINPGISWGEATSWATDRIPYLEESTAYIVANQGQMTLLYYGFLFLVVVGGLAHRRRVNRRLHAEAVAAEERVPG